ncbi:DNA-processing protein DprA [Psychromonas sp. MME2]|uniref:DNA-processing protein DprA n=1 Tax=unclassified Psychromonas TaxID=2614957 RepID=UPI00339C19C2
MAIDLFHKTDNTLDNEQEITRWLILDAVPGLPKRTLLKLLSRHSIGELLQLNRATLQSYKLQDTEINALLNPDMKRIDESLHWLSNNSDRHIISLNSNDYPEQLKEINNPPLLLYLQGDITLLKEPQIALVGSRKCTPYGQQKAYQFGADLSRCGFTITSGLALGVDGFAHQGALSQQGKTIAVLGTGLDNIYPKRHIKLAKEIIDKGLLVSEFWPTAAAFPSNFPRRNRIISGLSLGTFVIEASLRSGSLITARYALEQNRDVYALPGSIDNPEASGCHHLIQQGAKLVINCEDICNEYKECLTLIPSSSNSSTTSQKAAHPLLKHIDFHITPLEQIMHRSGLDIISLQNQLIELEITGSITVTAEGYIKLQS